MIIRANSWMDLVALAHSYGVTVLAKDVSERFENGKYICEATI